MTTLLDTQEEAPNSQEEDVTSLNTCQRREVTKTQPRGLIDMGLIASLLIICRMNVSLARHDINQ